QRAAAALELSTGRDVEYGAAFALALAGDVSRWRDLTNDLENRFPEDTSVRFHYLSTLRALGAIGHKDFLKAIELLQAASSHESGIPGIAFVAFFGNMNPVYMRGEAYLSLGKGAEAAAEFQKILDHRGLVLAD